MKTKIKIFKQVLLVVMLFLLFANSLQSAGLNSIKKPSKAKILGFGECRNKFAVTTSQVEFKTYTFTQLTSGDCVMQGGCTVKVYADGHAEFSATVWTNHTHSGDTWHHHIYFNNAAGAVIFQINFDGPNHMNDDGTHYPFNASFNFPVQIYNEINTVSMRGDC